MVSIGSEFNKKNPSLIKPSMIILENLSRLLKHIYERHENFDDRAMGYTVFSKTLPKEIYIDNYRPFYNYYDGSEEFQKWLEKNISAE